MEAEKKRVLVVSAHAVDFVWRAGGTIAQYAKNGHAVKIIDVTLGQRGESESLWKNRPGISEEEVTDIRKQEARRAAEVLGAEISFYDMEDHLLTFEKTDIMRLALDIRKFHPGIVLTHSRYDPLNTDHDNVHKAVIAALRIANVTGTFPEIPPTGQVQIFTFEPDQPDMCKFIPDTIIDVSDVYGVKLEAMKQVPTQAFMVETYGRRTAHRGSLAIRFKKGIQYAEGFARVRPMWESSLTERRGGEMILQSL
nr:PIG-L deacetylase family protein [uncultured Oscillibacter sp.]